MLNKYIEKAKDYFNRHPTSQECHITSDGRVFHTTGAAQGFAGTLNDETIETYKRTILNKSVESSVDPEAEKQNKLTELLALELVSSNYQEMKALVKYFDLKPIDQKAETLIATLTEFKNTLNQ